MYFAFINLFFGAKLLDIKTLGKVKKLDCFHDGVVLPDKSVAYAYVFSMN